MDMDVICKNVFNGKNPLGIILEKIRPNEQYIIRGYTMNDVEWNSTNSTSKPTQDEIDILLENLINEQTTINTWLPQRISAYPSITTQLDMLYWDQINGTTIWKDTITNIKKQFPKDN